MPDNPTSQWQDAIRRVIKAGEDAERSDYLHDDWEKQYPPLADKDRYTERIRRSRKAVSALRKMLKGPHAEIEGRAFEREPSFKRIFDFEDMVRSGIAGPGEEGDGEEVSSDEEDGDVGERDKSLIRAILWTRQQRLANLFTAEVRVRGREERNG